MRVLVLGGTVFLSAAVAAEAVRRGHEVSCLARATTAAPPHGARLLRVDREDGFDAYSVAGGDWDAVVEVSWQPRFVSEALAALADRAAHWCYVSSVSAYADQNRLGLDEGDPLLEPLPAGEIAVGETYGEAKVTCENSSRSVCGDRLQIVRAGLIGGPGDPSDRFGYWPARFARAADDSVLVPDGPDANTQTIDVRDLAAWMVTSAEGRLTGTFNAVGETTPLSTVLELAAAAAGHRGEMVAVAPGWLTEHDVRPWSGPESLPLWIPAGSGFNGMGDHSGEAAVAAGLHHRPLSETVTDSLEYERGLGLDRPRKAGLSAARETQLLAEWAATEAG